MRLNVYYHGQRVGQLSEVSQGVFFQYDVQWIGDGLELSPFELPLAHKVYGPFNRATSGLPGLVYDSLPDAFGMEVLRRRFEQTNRPKPTPMQLLAYQGSRTMGALTYQPCDGEPDTMLPVDVSAAADSARLILEHNHEEKLDLALLASGATAGGAQPKILVAATPDFKKIVTGTETIPDDMEPWLIKLSTKADQTNHIGALEAAYAQMAATAGINVPAFRLIDDEKGGRHFAVRRFDRGTKDPNLRIHIHSYSSLRHFDFRDNQLDYDQLLRTTLRLTSRIDQVEEQFRRMVFNVLTHNRDDHGKNFAFLMDADGQWHLSPAYDLIFCENAYHGNWMLVHGKRSGLTLSDFRHIGETFSLSKAKTDAIVEQICTATARWSEFAKQYDLLTGYAGVIDKELAKLRNRMTGE